MVPVYDRPNTLCGNPNCFRSLCADSTTSYNFCCYMCESKYFGTETGMAHGPQCNKKHKPDWQGPRAQDIPTARVQEMMNAENGRRRKRGRPSDFPEGPP